jgi:hypothetical protein
MYKETLLIPFTKWNAVHKYEEKYTFLHCAQVFFYLRT